MRELVSTIDGRGQVQFYAEMIGRLFDEVIMSISYWKKTSSTASIVLVCLLLSGCIFNSHNHHGSRGIKLSEAMEMSRSSDRSDRTIEDTRVFIEEEHHTYSVGLENDVEEDTSNKDQDHDSHVGFASVRSSQALASLIYGYESNSNLNIDLMQTLGIGLMFGNKKEPVYIEASLNYADFDKFSNHDMDSSIEDGWSLSADIGARYYLVKNRNAFIAPYLGGGIKGGIFNWKYRNKIIVDDVYNIEHDTLEYTGLYLAGGLSILRKNRLYFDIEARPYGALFGGTTGQGFDNDMLRTMSGILFSLKVSYDL